MRTQAEWNVHTHIALVTGPTSSATRWRISSAALLVNVIARIAERRHALVDEVGDAMGEHPGLARAGAGDDQQRPAAVDNGVELIGVEQVEVERGTLGRDPLGRQSHGGLILRKGCHVGATGTTEYGPSPGTTRRRRA